MTNEFIIKPGSLLKPAPILFYTSIAGIAFLFLSAPSFRFGASFFLLLPLCVTAAALFIFFRKKKPVLPVSIFLAFLFIITPLFEGYLFDRYFFRPKEAPMHKQEDPGVIAGRLIFPAPYFNNADYATPSYINETAIYIPKNPDWCWYDPFPTVPFLQNGLKMRGDNLGSGFVIGK